jgi:hypothetical protein
VNNVAGLMRAIAQEGWLVGLRVNCELLGGDGQFYAYASYTRGRERFIKGEIDAKDPEFRKWFDYHLGTTGPRALTSMMAILMDPVVDLPHDLAPVREEVEDPERGILELAERGWYTDLRVVPDGIPFECADTLAGERSMPYYKRWLAEVIHLGDNRSMVGCYRMAEFGDTAGEALDATIRRIGEMEAREVDAQTH